MRNTLHKNGDAQKSKYGWHTVDWGQPTSIISDQLGCRPSTVSIARAKYAPETVRGPHVKKTAMKEWAKGIDWSKTDREIAEETGRSRGAVWTTRNLMFQGKTPMPTRRRKVFRDCKPPSKLVGRFELLWRVLAGPELVKEFRFHPVRKWRADFAHLPSRTLIEIEGGIYVNGRHNRAGGFAADLKKFLEAALAGWRVVRLGPNELTANYVGRLVSMVSGG